VSHCRAPLSPNQMCERVWTLPVMISTRSLELVIDTVVCLTLAKWETVSGQFGSYLSGSEPHRQMQQR
jgi:hypothetical protein